VSWPRPAGSPCGHTSPGRLLPLPAVPEAGVGGATGSASVSTRGSSISGLLLRRSAGIGDVLDSLLALAEDAFYAAAAASWMPLGVCQKEDPELFFPAGRVQAARSQTDAAKTVCRRCPVRAECLSYTRGTGQQDGIWGGTTLEECWESGGIAPAGTNSLLVLRDRDADRGEMPPAPALSPAAA
jgi:WhiB family redox-sensing transcriptional regulator